MTDTFDPGPGWRRVRDGEDTRNVADLLTFWDGEASLAWVREVPVPPLPTAPFSVIRVTWKSEFSAYSPTFLLDESGTWVTTGTFWQEPTVLARRIEGFEVLAEPRAVTAKAVLDRVRELWGNTDENALDVAARDFGADQ